MTRVAMYPHDVGAGGGPPVVSIEKANQACYSCRKQKRKCDKALPACALCTRMGRTCDYSEVQPVPTAEDLEALRRQLTELERRLNTTSSGSNVNIAPTSSSQNDALSHIHTRQPAPTEISWEGGQNLFSPTLFLDGRLFKRIGLSIPRPSSELSSEILQCIGDAEALQHTLTGYFDDIHPWMPMVLRKRMRITYPMWDGGDDVVLLFLAMKLITSQPQAGFLASENHLYIASKRFIARLEGIGTASLQYLQTLILVALYEYGQGIYPAAWMTVAQCVRYAHFIGLPSYSESNNVLGQCTTWTEAEERRRTWWAVYVVDKIISIGSQKRPLCGEPAPNEILPINDKAWESGDASLVVQRTVTSPSSDSQSPFGRLCQCALLIAKMLRYVQRTEIRKANHERLDYSEVANITEAASSLNQCLQAELAADPGGYFSLAAARCLIFSASMKALSIYSAEVLGTSSIGASSITSVQEQLWTDEDLALRLVAVDEMKKTAAHVRDFAADLFAYITMDEDLVRTPPFVLDAVYSAAATFWSAWKEDADPVAETSLENLKRCLVRIGGRWRLGGEYLKLLDQLEMSSMIGQGGFPDRRSFVGIPMVISNLGGM
ncbi:fungal-specific transcription factor domain-containing protein [Camillea tinctor]|nr:fungal-specific transcription factor domain-containing protein [Camillea tinctor]